MKKESGHNYVNIGLLLINIAVIGVFALKFHFGIGPTDIFNKVAAPLVSSEKPVQKERRYNDMDKRKVEIVDGNSFGEEVPDEDERFLPDGSQITRQVDGFGNVAVTRTFRSHPLIRLIVVRTDRKKNTTVHVHPKNGKPVLLDEQFHENVLNDTADVIASNASVTDSKNVNQKRRERLAKIQGEIRRKNQEEARQRESERSRLAESESQRVDQDAENYEDEPSS